VGGMKNTERKLIMWRRGKRQCQKSRKVGTEAKHMFSSWDVGQLPPPCKGQTKEEVTPEKLQPRRTWATGHEKERLRDAGDGETQPTGRDRGCRNVKGGPKTRRKGKRGERNSGRKSWGMGWTVSYVPGTVP